MARQLRVLDDAAAAAGRPPLPDDFGFDEAYTERLLPIGEWIYRDYFRVQAEGVENVPAHGRCLLVANHSGVVPWDGAMIRMAVWLEHRQPRHARMLVADFGFAVPFVARLMARTGNVSAHPANAVTLLEREQLVGVFPEGIKGSAKPFKERYKVRRFGRGGFAQVALRTRTPIVPVAVVGGEEIHPLLFQIPFLADLLGLPVFPITPTFPLLGLLGALPLPSKWLIRFDAPVAVSGYPAGAADDPAAVLQLSEQIRDSIQSSLYDLLPRRQTAFW